jgi:hypothetical protein
MGQSTKSDIQKTKIKTHTNKTKGSFFDKIISQTRVFFDDKDEY